MTKQLIIILEELGFKSGIAYWTRFQGEQKGLGWMMTMPDEPLQYSHVHGDTISTVVFNEKEGDIWVNADRAHFNLAHLTPNFLYYLLEGLDFKTNANY